jgi:hypothetical protein
MANVPQPTTGLASTIETGTSQGRSVRAATTTTTRARGNRTVRGNGTAAGDR